tara:strand:- start:28436 stop:28693 length:258 start_codon:yes stop_codon:yes gene_type:complete
MTLQEIVKMVNKGQIFSAKFVKKNGEVRDMVCRLGVKKHLKGGELAFDAKAMNLLPVFDMQKEAYRMINISTLIQLKINGQVIKF